MILVRRSRRATELTAAFFAIAIFAPIAWMVMDRTPPYVRVSGVINPPDPVQGETISPVYQIIVRKACPPSSPFNVRRKIIDAKTKEHFFAPAKGRFGVQVTQGTPLGLPLQLPSEVAVGPAQYVSEACFACNPFQYLFPVCVNEPVLNFEIRQRTP